MDQKPLSEFWEKLAGRRLEFIRCFYSRLFQRFPVYRQWFPETMAPQMEKMVEMIGAVVQYSDNISLIRPYLFRIGEAHRSFGIKNQDLDNFKMVFVEAMKEACPDIWREDYTEEIEKAFDEAIIPMMSEGLRI